MASLSLINKVKYSPWLYSVYYYLGSTAIKFLRLFVKKDPHLIVFSSFGGRKFDDSPKCIYEQMIKDSRFDDYRIIWAFMHPEAISIPRGEKVKTDTLTYYFALLAARCWVTNSTMERGLSFKDSKTFYFNTWHGTPIKLMGSDINKDNKSFGSKERTCPYDVFCAQSRYDADIFKRSFNVPEKVIKIIGLPRNDELSNNDNIAKINQIKGELGIDCKKKVILYAPTFREYTKDENHNCLMAPPIHFDKWKKKLGEDYVILFRAHYEVVKVLNVTNDDFVIDVSSYPILNNLIIIADVLISDYSSIYFDFAATGKPMLCFAYDYDEYQKNRGLYFDIREALDCIDMDDEDKVVEAIESLDFEYRKAVTKSFRNQYVSSFGTATKKSLDLIYYSIR